MLNSSVYQLFVFPVEVAMEVRVQVALVVWAGWRGAQMY